MNITKLLCFVFLLGHWSPARASTINVPADKPTIQGAIDAAVSGDTVLVAPGTYYENLTIDTKEIILRSSGGAAKTTINGGNKQAVLVIRNTPSLATTVSGFTITNGRDTSRFSNPLFFWISGIAVVNAGATVTNNVVSGNNFGSEIGLNNSSALIQSNQVSTAGSIGGIGLIGASSIVDSSGAAVPTVIAGNTITGDGTGSSGEGINSNASGAILIEDNTIRSTSAGIVLSNMVFNTGSNPVVPAVATIRQNLISNSVGSAIDIGHLATAFPYTDPPAVFITNNTLVNNATTVVDPNNPPSSIRLGGTFGQIALINNIVTQATSLPILACADTIESLENLTSVILDHNDFYNSQGPVANAPCADPSGSRHGNISADPQFVSATDFHLGPQSPAIDAGTNGAYYLPQTDFDGNPRIQAANGASYATVDLGAYEFPGQANNPKSILTLTSSSYYLASPGTITLSALLQSGTTSIAPAPGVVTFYDNDATLSSVAAGNTGTADLVVPVTTFGIHGFRAHSEDGVSAADSPVLYVYLQSPGALPTATALTASAATANWQAPVTLTATVVTTTVAAVPFGTVTFYDGAVAIGSKPLDHTGAATFTTTSLTPGLHQLHAVYNGNQTFAGSASSNAQVLILGSPSITTLTANPTTAYQSQTVTLSASVTGALTTPTGSIQFLDGAIVLNTATLASGSATFSTALLSLGAHSITAHYLGDTGNLPSTSSPVTVTILPPDFTITTTSPTLTILTEHHAPMQVTITTTGGLADTIHLSCGNLPEFATCTFSSPDLTTTSEPTVTLSSTLTIDTDAVLGYAHNQPAPHPFYTPALTLALLLPVTLLAGSAARRHRLPRILLAALVTTAFALTLSSCSGKYPGHTSPGTYAISITAQGRASGITHITTLTLTVTQ